MKKLARVLNGVVVNISVANDDYKVPEGKHVCGDDVAIGWTFDGANFYPPVQPPPTVAEQKAAIDRQRDASLNAGFTYGGATFHCDHMFQSQVQAFLLAWAAGMLPAGASVSIRRKDNVTVQMTQAEVAALGGALMAHVQTIYAASWAAKDALS